MKTKKGFSLREICGEYVLVAEGKENIDFSNIISMNETGVFLWRKADAMDTFTEDDLVKALTDEYEVDETTAANDVAANVKEWVRVGIAEE